MSNEVCGMARFHDARVKRKFQAMENVVQNANTNQYLSDFKDYVSQETRLRLRGILI